MSTRFLIVSMSLFFLCFELTYSQNLSGTEIKKIKTEVFKAFNKSIDAGEKLDIKGIESNIDDSLRTGFIDNGTYFKTFSDLMTVFKQNIKGLESQELEITNKKVTVLSENKALLTTSGKYKAKILDGRILNGEFAWTFIYSKTDDVWKVIHSHMSNK